MKKILIVSHNLEVGGVERSLIGLLYALQEYDVSIDLFLLRHSGGLMNDIPPGIHLLPEVPQYTVLGRPIKDTLEEGHILLCAARLYGKARAYIYNKKHRMKWSAVRLEYSHKYTCRFMPRISADTRYDMAVSFLTPHYFVKKKVRASVKVAWIHTDYSSIRIDVQSELQMWSSYDHIIAISDSVRRAFISVFPTLEERITVISNILPALSIQKELLSGTCDDFPDEGIKILSIGRFCYAKNFDGVPEICRLIVESGLNVYWYLIGYGPDEQLIRRRIHEENMEERVIILGKKNNPYPYIEKCDLYVQPSRYEGNSVSVREAQFLQKPVVIADYGTSGSQLIDHVDGIIAPQDRDQFAKTIIEICNTAEVRDELIRQCGERDYTCSSEAEKLVKLIP